MSSLEEFCAGKLADLEARSLRRTLAVTERGRAASALRLRAPLEQRELISFCCNDYLNLTQNEDVKRAANDAIERYGVGAGASRLITGNHPLLEDLERRLAKLKGTEAAVVFGSGYLTNVGVIPTFIGPNDLILVDELAHACLHAGSQLSRADVKTFRHNDLDHAEALLSAARPHADRCMIITDGVFSMDGDLAPLPGLVALAQKFDAWLMTDDAHGIGVVGGGRGSTYAWGDEVRAGDVPLQMGTLSKAIGSYGGYLCAAQSVVDLVKTRARSLVYSTGLPPASAAAAIAALDFIEGHPDKCDMPRQKAALFSRLLNLPDPQSSIVPLIIGGEEETLAASQALEEEGFLVTAIRPPTVPVGTSRLRFTFTAEHEDDDIGRLVEAVRTHVFAKAAS